MATRAASRPDWKATFRRSLARASEIAGAVLLALAALFLALSLASYTQTDPSGSTAASGAHIANWMGAPGAWASDLVLGWFGLPAVLLLPLLYVAARRLWTEVETAGEADNGPWWRPFGLLLVAIVLLGTVLALLFEGALASLPAGPGGLAGLLGARAITAVAGRFGEAAEGWVVVGLAIAALAGGAALAAKVFAFDFRRFLTLPDFLHRRLGRVAGPALPLPGRRAERRAAPLLSDPEDDEDAGDAVAPARRRRPRPRHPRDRRGAAPRAVRPGGRGAGGPAPPRGRGGGAGSRARSGSGGSRKRRPWPPAPLRRPAPRSRGPRRPIPPPPRRTCQPRR
jgi:DNA segregation ATPase FtsK/SpoIIIE, S-DNA-T family